MSDVSITAANVLAGSNAKKATGTAGATITAGQVVYADGSDSGKFKLADANASAATANPVGVALHGAASGQPLTIVIEDDDFTPGGTLSLSAAADDGVYVLSGTAGGIAPVGDLASGWYPVILGVAKSASKMNLKIVRGTAALTA
ncbi:MAG: hypothetical protein L6Q98_08390 [Anaerolineae bacterium]|nr:hypothetical protein [Anaerolineae bacterium]NUQ02607.1 hypothetical protein [Anaerolineae bacterium]